MRRLTALVVLLSALLLLPGCGRGQGDSGAAGASPPPNPAPRVELRPSGKILFSKEKGIWVWNGGSTRQLTRDGYALQGDWSPDGRKIAFARMEDGYSDIWVMNASGGDQVNLTRFARSGADTWAFAPRWSPDGSQIAYLSDQNTFDLALWLMKPDGSGRRQVTFMNDYLGGIDGPTWHPKGDRLAFTAYRTGKPQIWALTLANGRWQQLTDMPGGAYDPQWSPSGEALAFVAREEGKSDVWVTLLPEGTPQRVTRDGLSRSPQWSPDGKLLAFLSGQGGKFDLWAVSVERTPQDPLRLGSPQRVTQGLGADPSGRLSWTK